MLIVRALPPTAVGLEEHLVAMRDIISANNAVAVVIDPDSSLTTISALERVRRMLIRMLWFIKSLGITCLTTHLLSDSGRAREAVVGLSSVMDTLVMLTAMEGDGERKRELRIVKARGIAHSDEIRQFKLGRKGVQIVEASANLAEITTGRRHSANSGHVRRLADQPAVGRQNATAWQ